MPVFDLHCDTLTAFMSPLRCRGTLDDPCSAFALSKVQTIPWCQCCAVFVPTASHPRRLWATTAFIKTASSGSFWTAPVRPLPARLRRT